MSDFNWNDAEDLIVLREQPCTAVYLNPNGDLVIRQMADYEDDSYIVIAIANVGLVARAMLETAGVGSNPATMQQGALTSAERSRRYRQRRNRDVVVSAENEAPRERHAESDGTLTLVAAE